MAHYIYGLVDPRTPEVVKYVGYTGYTIEYRLLQHIAEAKQGKHQSYKNNWIRKLLNEGVKPETILLEEVSNEPVNLWQEREKYWIDFYASTVTNGTIGGEGLTNPTQEVRDQIAAKCRIISQGNQYRKGIVHTDESKKAISESLKNSSDFKNAMLKFKGVDRHSKMTDEQKRQKAENISKAKTGKKRKPFSEETKLKMSEAKKGKILPSASAKKLGSRFINNGIEVKQIKANEPLPDGWVFGMKLKQPL